MRHRHRFDSVSGYCSCGLRDDGYHADPNRARHSPADDTLGSWDAMLEDEERRAAADAADLDE